MAARRIRSVSFFSAEKIKQGPLFSVLNEEVRKQSVINRVIHKFFTIRKLKAFERLPHTYLGFTKVNFIKALRFTSKIDTLTVPGINDAFRVGQHVSEMRAI